VTSSAAPAKGELVESPEKEECIGARLEFIRDYRLLSRGHHRRLRVSEIKGYHAHVYFSAATRRIAEGLRDTLIERFAVKPGGFSDEPRGPHPISQFNIIFPTDEFQKIVPWLMLNREGLDVLIHPLTESSYDDHSKNALWMGTPVPMRLDILRPTYRPEQLPAAAEHAG
jgi:aromatic ring-cleaving dioxygenase